MAEAAVVLHDAPLARRALAAITADPARGDSPLHPSAVERTRALVAAEEGHLSEAVTLLAPSGDVRSRLLARRLRAHSEQLQARELRDVLVHTPHLSPRPHSGSLTAVLHVVSNALPEQQAGYTIRTHGIVRAQRARGMDAHVVSRL
ncbi:MAG: hypothetical protein WA962_11265, partial [Ornithinimicrobium sp.]